jgi:hypothetical protein
MRRFPARELAAFAPAALALTCLALLAGCGGSSGEAPAAAGQRVENPALGVAIASLPKELKVRTNQGDELVLVPADGRPGTLRFEVAAPARGGVNLVQAVNDHKASIEARPDGEYRGQVELASPLGTAYASRGRYTGDGGKTVEELALFAVHPLGDRLLSLVYTYPTAGDTDARRDELIDVFGEVEGTATPPPAPSQAP